MTDINETELEAIVDGGHDLTALFEQAAAMPGDIEWADDIQGLGTISLRKDYRVETVDLEKFLPAPRRARGKVLVFDTASLVDWVNRYEPGNAPMVYVDRDNARVEAIIDENADGQPGWREHRAQLTWQKSAEWKRWTGQDRKFMKQEDFAEHVEDGLSEIVEPDATDLLDIAQTIRGTMNTEITSGRYLKDGHVTITWNESIELKGGAGTGQLDIPGKLLLQMAPFEGGTPIQITARLRFRVTRGSIEFAYLLDRPKDVERAAVDAEVSLIQTGLTGTTQVLMGNPG